MAYTQEDLDKIKAAIASGAKEVQYSDKKVVYQTTENMLIAQREIENELGLTEQPKDYKGGRRIGYFYRNC